MSVVILLGSLLSDPNPKLVPIYPNQFYAPLCLSSKLLANPLKSSDSLCLDPYPLFFCSVNYSSSLKIQFNVSSSEGLP